MIPVVSRMVLLSCQTVPTHPKPHFQTARTNITSTRSDAAVMAVQVARTPIRNKNVKQKVPTHVQTNANLKFRFFTMSVRVVSTFALMVEACFSIMATHSHLVNIPKISSITSPVLLLIWQSNSLKKMSSITF